MTSKQQQGQFGQGILTLGVSPRKRNKGGGGEGRGFDAIKASKRATTPTMMMAKSDNKPVLADPNPKGKDNRVLAGYLAHEFLTKGTLLGEKWDPARAEAAPIAPAKPNLKQRREATLAAAANGRKAGGGEVATVVEKKEKEHGCYAEVANLLRSDGVHIEGVFNPTQLALWLKM